MKICFLDIETTGVSADSAQLVAIAYRISGTEPELQPVVMFIDGKYGKEIDALESFAELIKDVDLIVTYWGSAFDLPFLFTRALILGVDLSILQKKKHIDLCTFVKKNLKFSRNDLGNVVSSLGVNKNSKFTSSTISGSQVPSLFVRAIQGDEETKRKLIEYSKNDLLATELLYNKLKPYLEVGE